MSTFVNEERLSQSIRLPDGRRLGYDEYGDLSGMPLFIFHGWPSTRLAASLMGEVASQRAVRLIAPDRPGIGLSDFQPGRAILDWPGDVVALADALGIKRFAVVGISGGGPYAAACAFKIPARLSAASIVSGMAPFEMPGAAQMLSRRNRLFLPLAQRAPSLL
ncbi:MAG: alpha/beta fold hydrolase, partial [Ardenticatenaceae bacterium]